MLKTKRLRLTLSNAGHYQRWEMIQRQQRKPIGSESSSLRGRRDGRTPGSGRSTANASRTTGTRDFGLTLSEIARVEVHPCRYNVWLGRDTNILYNYFSFKFIDDGLFGHYIVLDLLVWNMSCRSTTEIFAFANQPCTSLLLLDRLQILCTS
jgi:hypothetical protein